MVHTSGPAPGSGSTISASPNPRRLRAPSWLNFRLIVGVLLVLISVLVGARVVTAADRSDMVWAVQADLAAGTVLTGADLGTVSVRLADTGDAYLLSSADPVGRVLSAPVGAGELLARSALAETSTLVDIALPVAAGYVPPSLQRGQLVDIYALDATPSTTSPPTVPTPSTVPTVPDAQDPSIVPSDPLVSDVVTVVVEAAVVQLIAGRTDGALSVGSSTIQVVISVDAEQAPVVFAAIAGKELALAVRSSPSAPVSEDDRPAETRVPASTTPATPTD